MSVIVGSEAFTYEALDGWEQLPEGVRLVSTRPPAHHSCIM